MPGGEKKEEQEMDELKMDIVTEFMDFERWLRINTLPPMAQLIWYKIAILCHESGWPGKLRCSNESLMALMQISDKEMFNESFDMLMEYGFITERDKEDNYSFMYCPVFTVLAD